MANENISASLFGGTMLPEEMQQQLIRQRASEFAQLTPSQQLAQNQYTMSANAGQGLAKAMGVDIQDPAIKIQSKLTQLSQGIPQTAEGLAEYSRRITEAGLPGIYASQAMDKAREIAKTEADTGLKKAQATKAENFQQAQADKTQVRNLLADVETRLGKGEEVSQGDLNKAMLAYREKGQPVDHFDPATQTVVRLPGIDMSIYPNLTKAVGKTSSGGEGGGKVSVMQTPASEDAARNRLSGLEGSSAQLQTTLDTITQTKGLIGNNTTGWGSYLAGLPNTPAMTLSDNTDTIKASVALTKLMEMKKESKTGASGLGALNVKELETIQSILGKLNPKSANYATDLDKVEKFFVRAQKAMDEEIRLTKETPQQQPQRPAAPSGSPDVAPKPSAMSGRNPQLQPTADYEGTIQRNMAANKGYSREQVIANLIAAKRLPADYK
jgi:hypothetical protein